MSTGRCVSVAALRDFAKSVFLASGSEDGEAHLVADHLVDANLVGHDSHGVIRIAKYLDWLSRGMVLGNRHAHVVRESPCHAVIDGQFGYGQVIGREAVDIAIGKARAGGVCVLAIRNSGHLGRIGAWAEQAAEGGLAYIHFVNTSGFGILVAPFGGSDRRLSANPIAAGAPRADGPPVILDISTSAIAEGKIQVARHPGKELPEGCTIDAEGRPNRDPARFYGPPEGALLPIGGHKGYGLSVFCEILAGALTGGLTTNPSNETAGRLVNNMLSVVFDPAAVCGVEEFKAEVTRMAQWVKGSPPAVPGGEVLLPGEIERRTRAERENNGIPIDAVTRQQINEAVRPLGLELP